MPLFGCSSGMTLTVRNIFSNIPLLTQSPAAAMKPIQTGTESSNRSNIDEEFNLYMLQLNLNLNLLLN